jgi:hypothetical protein
MALLAKSFPKLGLEPSLTRSESRISETHKIDGRPASSTGLKSKTARATNRTGHQVDKRPKPKQPLSGYSISM